VNIQRFVEGTPANSAVACWNGEVLASISVAAVRTRGAQGASTVVRIVDHPEMIEAGAKLVRRLGLSGFCGFDFILEAGTSTAHLVEMNARTTPISHLPLAEGRNLVTALATRLDGITAISPTPAILQDIIAFFPQAWLLEPNSELLHSGYHDVPWGEQALVRELMKLPWPERGFLARLLSWLRQSAGVTAVSALPVHYGTSSAGDLSARL
jgi:predicted ATP-grasp superfamily ATP-dependent carboligase